MTLVLISKMWRKVLITGVKVTFDEACEALSTCFALDKHCTLNNPQFGVSSNSFQQEAIINLLNSPSLALTVSSGTQGDANTDPLIHSQRTSTLTAQGL